MLSYQMAEQQSLGGTKKNYSNQKKSIKAGVEIYTCSSITKFN